MEEKKQEFILYHGTNRKFKMHDHNRHRTVLNDKYQGDWFCYTEEESVAWDYARAQRNQNYDKENFVSEMKKIFSTLTDDKGFNNFMIDTSLEILENGYSASWDNMELKLGEDLYVNYMRKTNNLDFDFNDFLDCLENVECSNYSKDENTDNLSIIMNIFHRNISEIDRDEVKFLKGLGFSDCLPEERVYVSKISAKKILETDDKEKAKKALDGDYDLVIYSGEGTVKSSKEYLVKDNSQINIIEIKKMTYTEIENEDGYKVLEGKVSTVKNNNKLKIKPSK